MLRSSMPRYAHAIMLVAITLCLCTYSLAANENSPTLTQSDFQYAGYYTVPNGGSFADLNWGQGFTTRYVNGQLRFMTLSFFGNQPGGGYQLIEFAAPSAVGGTVSGLTNHWPDIFTGTGTSNGGVWMGLWYEQARERLWTTWAIDYPNDEQSTMTKTLSVRTLNADGTISNAAGAWGLQGINQRRIYGGVTAIPPWFQTKYNVGPYGCGWGGYASRMGLGPVSMGPTFYAIPDPTAYPIGDIPAGQFKTLMDHSSGSGAAAWYPSSSTPTSGDRGVRNADVINQYDNWSAPAPDGLGRWVWGDSAWNTGNWIDGPSKQGFIIVPKFSSGRAWYEGSTLHRERQSAEIQVFDPNVLGEVANGARASWNTYPSSRWEVTADMTPLGLMGGNGGNNPFQGPAGASYDSRTRTLYVYCPWSTNNFSSKILMYKVDAHPGDANGDNAVDVVDLGILATNYDLTGKTMDDGDFNNDGNVDVVDLGILATNYDWTYAGQDVPEPATLALLGLGGLALLRRKGYAG